MWINWFIKSNIGKVVGGYRISRIIGEGRYGICFLATSPLGEEVVIKKFKTGFSKRRSDQRVGEALALSALDDPRVPAFLGVINQPGFYGFILSYMPGETVRNLLFRSRHQFSRAEFFSIGHQLIDIIRYLHGIGFIHGDIRIDNVVIHENRVALLDYGLAYRADQAQHGYALDFSYLGDFLLYLLYSSFEAMDKSKEQPWHRRLPWQMSQPWHKELPLTDQEQLFLKKLFGLEPFYQGIDALASAFIDAFGNPLKTQT